MHRSYRLVGPGAHGDDLDDRPQGPEDATRAGHAGFPLRPLGRLCKWWKEDHCHRKFNTRWEVDGRECDVMLCNVR